MSDNKRDGSATPPISRKSRREPATIDGRAHEVTPPPIDPVAETVAEASTVTPDVPVMEGKSEPAPETLAETVAETVAETFVETPREPTAKPEPLASMPRPRAASSPDTSLARSAIAGLVGAIVALLGAAGWQAFTASDKAADPAVAALEKRIASAEARLGTVPTAEALASLDKRIAATETKAAPAGPAVNLGPLEQRLTALEKAPRTVASAAPALSPDLEKRLAALEAAASAPKSTDRATESRVEPTAPPATPPVDLKPLEARVAAVEQRLQPLQSSIAGSSEAAKAATAKIDEEATRSRAAAQASAQAIAAQSLQQALERGAPLKAEIDTLARLGVAQDRLAALAPYAAAGAPSARSLAASFQALESKLTEPDKPLADAGVMDRLSQAAQRLVRVRPAGEPSGTSPNDLVARIEAALAAGNIAAAVAAWELLPAAAKTASADWAASAKARLAADTAARTLAADALAALGRSKS